ncbi:hypothetical protein BP6252_06622 [Coleophoma cylindrospora]|uniref:Uncharacterized protein n=1 Tax=Coleophoma cylindrospora TaxID=1849047 RepID=A0A3D8RNF0_9HELO|nr:hypothetical protein BP6252_06622 [Coleophoma cylindrospora]
MHISQFLSQWTYEVEEDFKGPDGTAAKWASGQPAAWGQESKKISLGSTSASIAIAVDPSGSFLAVAVEKEIWVYSVSTLERTEVLKGHTEDVRKVAFRPQLKSNTSGDTYSLASSSNHNNGSGNMIILWHLDSSGKDRNPQTSPQPTIDSLTTVVSRALVGELQKYDWDENEKAIQEMIKAFRGDITTACVAHNLEHRTVLPGSFFGFGSQAFANDGALLFFKTHAQSTQHGMRPPDQLPCINVWNTSKSAIDLELRGHTDSIMWVGASPNNEMIASAAWDQSIRIWDIKTGECLRNFGPFGGQMWSCAFSPDSKYIAFHQGNPQPITFVYNIENGTEVSKIEEFKSWARSMDWGPDGNTLAAGGGGGQLCVWDPYTGKLLQNWQLAVKNIPGGRSFMSVAGVEYIEDGKKLMFKTTDGSIEVYDFGQNLKWHFGKGKKDKVTTFSGEETFCWSEKLGMIISADSDGSIRFWEL